MSKFNTRSARPAAGRGPVAAQPTPSGRTHEGGAGYAHDAKSELFLLAVANFVGENTFYDKATDRDRRYAGLVQDVAATDPQWTGRLQSGGARADSIPRPCTPTTTPNGPASPVHLLPKSCGSAAARAIVRT